MRQQSVIEKHHELAEGSASTPHEPFAGLERAVGARIDDTIRVRDLHQFEIKLNYPLSQDRSIKTYDLECYIFIPHSLGFHRANYSKVKFYDDLQTHIRFKTPSVSLTRIGEGPESPLIKLEASAIELQEPGRDKQVGKFEYRLKLFCCILQSSLREFVDFISEVKDQDDRDRVVQQYLAALKAITKPYRALRPSIFLPTVSRHARAIYAFGDEYVSLLVERNSYDLLQHLRDADSTGWRARGRKIMDLISHEVNYRESRRYPSIPNDQSDNEELIFRRNVLKKYMQNVLFLDTRTRDEGKVIEHSLFGIAAGISMLFATVVLFVSQSIYGSLTLPVFLALVIGYMFKDRIKEILRVYFSRVVSSVLFDHKIRIYSDPHHPVGHCRESFDFVDEAKVPERVMKIRARSHITEIESDWVIEDVLRYRKRIKLYSRAMSAVYRDIDTAGINDIMRFNIAEFTRRMGNPKKELFVLDGDGYRKVKAERVYHLNMVLRYGGDDGVMYKRLRIVLNRRKIKRIETVSAEEE
jgi:hypothetical protein